LASEGGGLEFGVGFFFDQVRTFCRRFCSQGKDVHFGGAEAVETPGVPGDGVGEFEFGDGFGREAGYVFRFEFFEDGAVGVVESGDLAGDVVADGVEAGFRFAFGGVRAGGFLRVGAVCFDLFLRCHAGVLLV